ncbi:MAG: elements of external origin [Nitrospinota bacterium]
MSVSAYARHRGCSRTAVQKAISSGRIFLDPDGKIDPKKADQKWAKSTSLIHGGKRGEKGQGNGPADESRSTTFNEARTAHEVFKARLARLEFEERKGKLIEWEKVERTIFRLAREERDSWLNWPARVSALMAAEIGVDANKMHGVLERSVREHLAELSEIKLEGRMRRKGG